MMKRYFALLMSLWLLCLSACSRPTVQDDVSSQDASVNETSSADSEVVGEAAQSSLLSSSSPDGEDTSNTQTPSHDAPLETDTGSAPVFGDSGSHSSSSENNAYAHPTPLSYDDLRISPAVEYTRDKSSPSSDFLEAVRAFSYASSSQLLTRQKENTVYSPIGVYYPLALLAAGAKGDTRDQILSVLGLSGQSNDAFTRQCQLLYCNTRRDSKESTFLTANSLWVRQGLTLQPDFGRIAAERFFAPIYSVDFSDPATSGWMQDWVSDNTKGLIRPQIQPSSQSQIFVCNTIYLKGNWTLPFSDWSTYEEIFTREDSTQIPCDFMHATQNIDYVKKEGYARADLRIDDIGVMSFILPDPGTPLEQLTASPETLASLLEYDGMSRQKVRLSVPKVDLSSKVSMMDTLGTMGIRDLFLFQADLSAITTDEQPLYVESLTQQTRLKWDEQGVEAAAYTEASLALRASKPDIEIPVEFKLDRPFLFILRKGQNILFIGTCYQPN